MARWWMGCFTEVHGQDQSVVAGGPASVDLRRNIDRGEEALAPVDAGGEKRPY